MEVKEDAHSFMLGHQNMWHETFGHHFSTGKTDMTSSGLLELGDLPPDLTTQEDECLSEVVLDMAPLDGLGLDDSLFVVQGKEKVDDFLGDAQSSSTNMERSSENYLSAAISDTGFDSVLQPDKSPLKIMHIDIIEPVPEKTSSVEKDSQRPRTSVLWKKQWKKSKDYSMLSMYVQLVESTFEALDNVKCLECGMLCLSVINLQNHVIQMHEKHMPVNRCFVCSKAYIFEEPRDHHMVIFHNIHCPQRVCPVCLVEFSTPAEQQAHVAEHEPALPCSICHARFLTDITLLEHQEAHLALERPHQCQDCGACFRNESVLLSHQKRHPRGQCLIPDCLASHDALKMWLHIKDHDAQSREALKKEIMAADKREMELDSLLFSYKMLLPLGRDINFKSVDQVVRHSLNQICTVVTGHLASKSDDCTLDEALTSFEEEDLGGKIRKSGPSRACPICRKRFRTLEQVKRHVRVHLQKAERGEKDKHVGKKGFQCRPCKRIFFGAEDYVKHMEDHLNRGRVACEKCGRTFAHSWHKALHMEKVHDMEVINRPYSCNVCLLKFSTRKARDAHLQEHTPDASQHLKCQECGQSFPQQQLLQSHQLQHKKELMCPHPGCEKVFKSASLRVHMKMHRPEVVRKRFQCLLCSKLFVSKYERQTHMRIHTGERPFMCQKCGITFKRRQALKRHEENVHGSQTHASYLCPVCSMGFSASSNLLRHVLRIHHDFRRFICAICGNRYGHYQDLRRHLKSKHAMNVSKIGFQEKKSNDQVYVIPDLCDLPCNALHQLNIQLIVEEEVEKLNSITNLMSQVPRKSAVEVTPKLPKSQKTGKQPLEKLIGTIEGKLMPVLPRPDLMCRHCNLILENRVEYDMHLESQVLLECKECKFRCCDKGQMKVHRYELHSMSLETLLATVPLAPCTDLPGDSLQNDMLVQPEALLAENTKADMSMLNLAVNSEPLQGIDVFNLPSSSAAGLPDALMLPSTNASSKSLPTSIADAMSSPANFTTLLTFPITQPDSVSNSAQTFVSIPGGFTCAPLEEGLDTVSCPVSNPEPSSSYSALVESSVPADDRCRFQCGKDPVAELNVVFTRDGGSVSQSVMANPALVIPENFPNKDGFRSGASSQNLVQDVPGDTAAIGSDKQCYNLADVTDKSDLPPAGKKVTCKECKKEFPDLVRLERHSRVHGSKPFKCEVCERAFVEKHNLKVHMRVHTGEKPFLCNVCGMRLRYKKDVSDHLRLHTGEKPHKCNQCDKAFVRLRELKRHAKLHSSVKKHSCPICNKTFSRLDHLKSRHLPTHKEDKAANWNFECDICGKRFPERSKLARHNVLHSGKKEHTCKICRKTFALQSYLRAHELIHKKQEHYIQCPKCPRKFSSANTLQAHVAKFHGQLRKGTKRNGSKGAESSVGHAVSSVLIKENESKGHDDMACSQMEFSKQEGNALFVDVIPQSVFFTVK